MEEKTKKRRMKPSERRRLHNVILAGVFLLLIFLFAFINLCTKTKDYSETENRNLAQKPELSGSAILDGSYFSGLSSYLSDQFFARDGWISLKLRTDSALGKKESAGVFLCKDDYLIAQPDSPIEEARDANIQAINAFMELHPEIDARMMLVPTAAAILTDKLPKNAPVHDQLADMNYVRQNLNGSIQYIDVASTMMQHADEYIYYKTDHHWTSLGAYYAFAASSGIMGIGSPIQDYTTYTVTEDFEGTLSSKSGSHRTEDSIDIYIPNTDVSYYVNYVDSQTKVCSLYQSECLNAKDKYTVFFGGNHPILEIVTTANNDRSILIFKDSYANSFIQFLIPYYENIILVDPRYYYDNITNVLSEFDVTDILFLYCSDTFMTNGSLADVLNSVIQKEPLENPMTAYSADAEDTFGEMPAPEPEQEQASSAEEAGSIIDRPDSSEETN